MLVVMVSVCGRRVKLGRDGVVVALSVVLVEH